MKLPPPTSKSPKTVRGFKLRRNAVELTKRFDESIDSDSFSDVIASTHLPLVFYSEHKILCIQTLGFFL